MRVQVHAHDRGRDHNKNGHVHNLAVKGKALLNRVVVAVVKSLLDSRVTTAASACHPLACGVPSFIWGLRPQTPIRLRRAIYRYFALVKNGKTLRFTSPYYTAAMEFHFGQIILFWSNILP